MYYGTDTRAQSLLIGAVVGILLFMHGPIRVAARARVAIRVAAAVGAAYTLWLFWRMSERTDALYQGGFLFAALAVSAVIVSVVQPDRGVLGRVRCRSRRCAGSAASPTASTSGTGRCTSRSPTTRTGLDGFALLARPPRGERRARARCRSTRSSSPIRAGTFRLPKPQIVALVVAAALVVGRVRHHDRRRRLGRRETSAPARARRAEAQAAATGGDPRDNPPARCAAAADRRCCSWATRSRARLGSGSRPSARAAASAVWNRGRLGCGLFYGGSVYEGGELAAGRPRAATGARTWPEQLDSSSPTS